MAYRLNKSYKWGNFMHIIGTWCGSKSVDETVLISVTHFKGCIFYDFLPGCAHSVIVITSSRLPCAEKVE